MNLKKWFKGKEMKLPSKELQQTIIEWYTLKAYGDKYENLHRDTQADIDHYFDASGEYGQVLSDNDWGALCKEWAWDSHRYKLKSGIYIGKRGHLKENEYSCTDYEEVAETADSEPGAVYLASEWIFKQNKITGKQEKIDGELGASR